MSDRTLRRHLTVDRGPPGEPPPPRASLPLEVGTIGPKRSVLPDGSVLCREVPIARTGTMRYAPGEVPITESKDPLRAPVVFVDRGPDDLFNETTMRSFIGVAVTHDHPTVPVTPSNFATFGKGFILRTYRGEGADSDCLMADIVIKDKWTIDRYHLDVEGPVNCEVSCGYEASYSQTGDGMGRQYNIIGNHLALVERGRCGPRCAIGDEDTLSTTVKEEHMTTPANTSGKRARIPLAELRTRVADTLGLVDDHLAEGGNEEGVHVHVHMGAQPGAEPTPPAAKKADTVTLDAAVEERFAAIEEAQAETKDTLKAILEAVQRGGAHTPAPAGTEDVEAITEATATMDSAALSNSYQEFLSQAEILVPGFRLPTFDAAAQRKLTVDRMCQGRRMVLGALQSNKDGAALLMAGNGGKDFDVLGASCPDVAVAFKAAAKAKAESNNRAATGDAHRPPVQNTPAVVQKTMADINAENKKFWQTQGPRA